MDESSAFRIVLGQITLEAWCHARQQEPLRREERRLRGEEKRLRGLPERKWNSHLMQEQTALVFRTAEGPILGFMQGVSKYEFTVQDRLLDKLNVFCFYPGDLARLWEEKVERSVQAQGLRPPENRRERPDFPEQALQDSLQAGHMARVKLYDGLVLRGSVEWNAFYSFSLRPEHAPQIPVVIFKHGVLEFSPDHQAQPSESSAM